ncbi:kinetochore scaffold 1 [Brachyistius frenatus]|uniref:kinetochore scaffold 1 n=1 Tax=Brachyistius frenatus TaxID=100188 RepID=UPI0037E7CF02
MIVAATAATQNRGQIAVTEDGGQIMGMENLLNAPLHASQQREEVNFDTRSDFGEKTVMFSTDDPLMDMTHSHTVNIAGEAELFGDVSVQRCDIFPTGGEQRVMFTVDNGSTGMTPSHPGNIASGSGTPSTSRNVDSRVEKRNVPALAPCLDPGFANFLASLSKPTNGVARMTPPAGPSAEETNSAQAKATKQRVGVDKENLAPTFASALMEKSLTNAKTVGETYYGSALWPDDARMDVTEAQTGVALGGTDDDPFQCLFPTRDMYAHSDGKVSQRMKSKRQHSGETSRGADPGKKEKSSFTVPPPLCASQRQKLSSDANDERREKTVMFTAGNEFMDMTRSHTMNIAVGPFAAAQMSGGNFELGFKNFLASLSNPNDPIWNREVPRLMPTAAPTSPNITSGLQSSGALGSSKHKGLETSLKPSLKMKVWRPQDKLYSEDDYREKTVRFSADDARMSMTRSLTVNIATELQPQSRPNVDLVPAQGDKTVRFTANDAAMDMTQSHTVNIATDLQPQSAQNVDFMPANEDKTVRFTANDAAMDMTQSHTVNIATDLQPQSAQNVDLVPAPADKTVRFTANDAAMDMTQSHTVNIATDLHPQSAQNVDLVPANEDKTVRFTANDAAMDMTQSHTVNIATDLHPQSAQNVDLVPAPADKTVRFTANDAAMDMTQSHTVNIATDFEPKSHPNVDFLPTCGEKTVRFTAEDMAMDMTQCLTVNIDSNSASNSVSPHQNVLPVGKTTHFPFAAKKRESETFGRSRNRSLSARGLDPGYNNYLSMTSGPKDHLKAEATSIPFLRENPDINGLLPQLETQKPDMKTGDEAGGSLSAVLEKSVSKTETDSPEITVSMDMTEAQTGYILGPTCTDEPLQCLSSTQAPDSEHVKNVEASDDAVGTSNPDDAEITKLLDSSETETKKEPEPRTSTSPSSQKTESSPSAGDQDADTLRSRKSRRQSLADIQSKVRRLSAMINTAPDAVATDACTAPLPQTDHDPNANSQEKNVSLPVEEPELEMGLVNTEDDTGAERPPATATATPFSLNTKHLMSRFSMGGLKAKLPQRSKPDDSKKAKAAENTGAVNVDIQLSNFDNDVSNIYDEELDGYEDVSETLDIGSPPKIPEKEDLSQQFNMEELLEEDVFEEDFMSAVQGQKRPFPEGENNMEDEKRMQAPTEIVEMSNVGECESNIAARTTTQTIDSSSGGHTASIRCEATFESTFKQSMFELDDHASEGQKKLEDGSITVSEFFKLFNIDFVIHNPRQSVLPGGLLSDPDLTPMDLLKAKHINRPKQMVYETNVTDLTEKVTRLKVRMQDLDKPLKTVNRPLWEEMKHSTERELKSFGAKLKERSNFFRKTSKVQSHEMKEILYTNLIQASLEEQLKVRGTIGEADEMLKSLDDYIHELETEITAVEEKGFENKPSLKSIQKEIMKINKTLADDERQMCELEMQRNQTSNKLCWLREETRTLEEHIAMLHLVNEWKFKEAKDNCKIYTFLYNTLYLELVFESSDDDDDDDRQRERKISRITFRFDFDEAKSQGYARLVHKLVSQYIEGESAWVEKYSMSRHIPKLFHDVSLVVGRCRLLGEEVRRLKMWGSIPLNILDIDCDDARVCIMFSSLKKIIKFEVMLAVNLINNCLVFHVQSFMNLVGRTKVQSIKEIVSSFPPGKNRLTKIVKKIHETFLC